MDFEADAVKGPTPDQLETIVALAKEQLELETMVADLEDQLKNKKAMLRVVQEGELPTALQDASVSAVNIEGFGDVSYKEELKCSIAKKNAQDAHAWLRENGHGSLIKNELVIRLGTGDFDKLEPLHEMCTKLNLTLETKGIVHAGTLKAFCKEKREEGADLPEDLLGIFPYRKAKIKKGK